jgi:uncharacterized membrane protein
MLRPLTRRLSHPTLLSLIENNIDWLIKLHVIVQKAGLGRLLNRFLPVCDISNTFPKTLTKQQTREWAVLDTFDMFSPRHDHPQRIETVRKWVEECGMRVTFSGFVRYEGLNSAAVVRGIKL